MMGQCTLLTGAGHGLGRSMALGLLTAGHSVVAVGRDAGALGKLKDEASGRSGKLAIYPADLTDSDSAKTILAFAERVFGAVSSLVNCAGVGQEIVRRDFISKPVKFWEVDEATTRLIFATNTDAVFRLCATVVPGMIERKWGRIVNVTTSLESMIRVGMSPYGPAKAATEAFSAIIAKELQDTGVTVNVLIPGGPAATRMMPELVDKKPDSLILPDVMVPPILWLLSPQSDGVSGRRFRANLWDPSLDPRAAAEQAGAPAAWPGLAGGTASATYREKTAHAPPNNKAE